MGQILDKAQAYKDGKIDFAALKEFLVKFDYQDPPERDIPDGTPPSVAWEADDLWNENTWTEVDAALDHELLTEDEYLEIHEAVLREWGHLQ